MMNNEVRAWKALSAAEGHLAFTLNALGSHGRVLSRGETCLTYVFKGSPSCRGEDRLRGPKVEAERTTWKAVHSSGRENVVVGIRAMRNGHIMVL